MNSQLTLKNLILNVKLGHSEAERFVSQPVVANIRLQFASVPTACVTDSLNDTLCYATLSYDLQKFCDERSFKLIESLGYQLYQLLRKKLTDINFEQVNVCLCVAKNPPLNNLEQSGFSISD